MHDWSTSLPATLSINNQTIITDACLLFYNFIYLGTCPCSRVTVLSAHVHFIYLGTCACSQDYSIICTCIFYIFRYMCMFLGLQYYLHMYILYIQVHVHVLGLQYYLHIYILYIQVHVHVLRVTVLSAHVYFIYLGTCPCSQDYNTT